MRKSFLLFLSLIALVAFVIAPTVALAGPASGSDEAKAGKGDHKSCLGHADAKIADAKCCDFEGKCETVHLSIKGMTCGGCENSITTTLKDVDGVIKVQRVSHKDGLAVLCVDPAKTKGEVLAKVVTSKGYRAEIIKAVADSKTAGTKGAAGCATMTKEECVKECGAKAAASCGSKKKADAGKTDGSL